MDSNFSLKLFVYEGAPMVLVAHPFFCKYLIPLKAKLFRVRIKNKNLTNTLVAVGFTVYLPNISLMALMRSRLGIFVKIDLTFIVTNMESFAFSSKLPKFRFSVTQDGGA